MNIKITVEHNGISKEFTKIEKAKEYIESLEKGEVEIDFMKAIQESDLMKDWLKENDNLVPLGRFSTSSYKGMTETYDEAYIEKYDDDDNNIYEYYYNKIHDEVFEDEDTDLFYCYVQEDAHRWPTNTYYYARISEDFSTFEIYTEDEENY